MTITKKELLKLTGISYGQLYRWKRSGLIPEEWFIKRSSYTGQETVFPKDKIIERIATIQELKDQYSLEVLSQMLSTQKVSKSMMNETLLEKERILDGNLVALYKEVFEKEGMTYQDTLLIYAFMSIQDDIKLKEMKTILKENKNAMMSMDSFDYVLWFLYIEKKWYLLITRATNDLLIDSRIHKIKIDLNQYNEQFKKQYASLF